MSLYSRGVVIVTGGSGFIGTHLIGGLIDKGATVVNLDRAEPVLDSHRRYWRQCDLLCREQLFEQVTKTEPAIIYNLAAHASLDGSEDDMRVNFVAVDHLISACRAMVSSPLLVQASTQLVAGPATDEFDPEQYRADSAYGLSKVRAEQILRSSGLRWTIARPTNIWGPYHPSFARNIWRYLAMRTYLQPSGFDVIRSYGYVKNAVHQLLSIAEVEARLVEGETFYVGDEPIPSAVWLDAFSFALTGKPVRRVPLSLLKMVAVGGELLERVKGRAPINLGRFRRMTTNFPVPMKKTMEILGAGQASLAEGVSETVSWLRKNELIVGTSSGGR